MSDSDAAVSYWIDLADYDLQTAQAMLATGRYVYVGFMCHLAIEKLLKACYVHMIGDSPPRIHNLSRLASLSGVYLDMDDSQRDFLEVIAPMNIEARYPTDRDMLLESLTAERCESLIVQTGRLSEWIKKRL